jgi:hypothetical protein
MWGQAYTLTVRSRLTAGSDETEDTVITSHKWEPEALHMIFEVRQAFMSDFWYADISVYNMDDATIQTALEKAVWVTLEAGFQTGPNVCSTIWDGPVLQTIYDREEVVDQRITFHCVANPFMMDDIIAFSQGPFSSQQQLIARMAHEINMPEMSYAKGTMGPKADQATNETQYLRGYTVFGKIGKYLTQIADDHFMQTFRDGSQAYMSEMSRPDTTPDFTFSPPYPPDSMPPDPADDVTYSVIGTPRQTPQGCMFTVLLDPRLKIGLPPQVVRLRRTLISQVAVNIGGTVSAPLTQGSAQGSDLKFFLQQVTHRGDTRGNDWYTEVIGVSTTYADSMQDGVFGADSK